MHKENQNKVPKEPLAPMASPCHAIPNLFMNQVIIIIIGCQCGVWCCAFVTKFLSFSELSRPRLFTLIPDYFVNTNNNLEMTSNTERIRDYRKTLQLLLIDKNE